MKLQTQHRTVDGELRECFIVQIVHLGEGGAYPVPLPSAKELQSRIANSVSYDFPGKSEPELVKVNQDRFSHPIQGPWYIPMEEMEQWWEILPNPDLNKVVAATSYGLRPRDVEMFLSTKVSHRFSAARMGLIRHRLNQVLDEASADNIEVDEEKFLLRLQVMQAELKERLHDPNLISNSLFTMVYRSCASVMIALEDKEMFTEDSRNVWGCIAPIIPAYVPSTNDAVMSMVSRAVTLWRHCQKHGMGFEELTSLFSDGASAEDNRIYERGGRYSVLERRRVSIYDPSTEELLRLDTSDKVKAFAQLMEFEEGWSGNGRWTMPIVEALESYLSGLPVEWLYRQ